MRPNFSEAQSASVSVAPPARLQLSEVHLAAGWKKRRNSGQPLPLCLYPPPSWPCELIAVVLLLLSGVPVCASQAPAKPLILGVKIEGTQRPLKLNTQVGDLLERECVARDLRQLWASGEFDDIRVEIADREISTPTPSFSDTTKDSSSSARFLAPTVEPSSQNPLLGESMITEDQTPRESGGVYVVFKVVERSRYVLRGIKFQPSYRRYPVEDLHGNMVDKKLAHQVATKLEEKLAADGYLDAVIQTEVVPVDLREAELLVRVRPGQRYQLRQVKFSGTLAFDKEVLQQALRQNQHRSSTLGLGSLWKGPQPFSYRGVESDVEYLRSFYFSRGYWNAVVSLDRVGFDENEATVFIAVESGPHYDISRAEISGVAAKTETILPSGTVSSTESLCRCLRDSQRKAEQTGKLDFAVHLDVQPSPSTDLTDGPAHTGDQGSRRKEVMTSLRARIEAGPSYKVGRIDFQGNHNFGDLTLRRALLLNEGDLFDYGKLRGSLTRLNQMGLLETLTQDQVRMVRNPVTAQVDLTLMLKEKPRGRWDLSGSMDPLSLLKPVQFSIGSRLPDWTNRTLELSTFFGAMSLFPLGQPLTPAFLIQPGSHWKPLLAFGRPYLPGQEWRSGFVFLPQIGWKGTAYNSSVIQVQRVTSALGDDWATPPTLTVSVWRTGAKDDGPAQPRFVGSLLCDAPKPHLAWVKSATMAALDLALTIPRF